MGNPTLLGCGVMFVGFAGLLYFYVLCIPQLYVVIKFPFHHYLAGQVEQIRASSLNCAGYVIIVF